MTNDSILKNTPIPNLSPDDAWKLWNKLGDIANDLWNAYENDFLKLCFEEIPSRFPEILDPPDDPPNDWMP